MKLIIYLNVVFFNTSGSKINSELDRMLQLTQKINNIENKQFKFIYVIDGPGLKKNLAQIKKFQEISNLYNLKRFIDFLDNDLIYLLVLTLRDQ
ncbi:DpnII family type II restriction endonuclease ['Camptotheca acuminata' phytoplasma]|uniref:DpnII family type II restriction endonuclease n=1 Tax='Camptotheca acuminata' phytoplasma TaxID=3239192 RepID=UPI00351AB09F